MQIGSSTSAYSSTSLSQMHSKLFSSIDANTDGSLTLEELESSEAAKKTSGKTETTGATAAERFASMDTDGNGSVTEDEGLAFFTSSMSSSTMGGMLAAQEESSASSSSSVSAAPSGPPPAGGGGSAPQSFDELDTNEDGTVSLDEMLASSESEDSSDTSKVEGLFAAMDADGDGAVTEDEKTSFDEQMKANGPPPGGPQGETLPEMASSESASTTTETTAETIDAAKALLAQWMSSMYSALSENAETTQASTTSVAA